MKANVACLSLFLTIPFLARADEQNRGFSVDFSQCTEAVGVGPVSLSKASVLVPSVFNVLSVPNANASPTAGIVVRATSCAGVRVDGGPAVPTKISQIGVELVPPDGTGDINNYTLVYVSNNGELVEAFHHAGVPALFDSSLTYQFTYDSTGVGGEIYVEAEGFGLPAYFINEPRVIGPARHSISKRIGGTPPTTPP